MSIHGSGDRFGNGSMSRILTRAGATALLIAGLAGCSAVPDWAKPGDVFGDGQAAESPSGAGGFPALANVPNEKPATTSPAQQKDIANGLAADRAAARHSDEVLRGGTEPPAPAPQLTPPTPVEPLKDVPPEALPKKSSNEQRVLPMPGPGGHASLAAARGVKTAQADTARSDAAPAEAKPSADAEQPVNAAPTTPVEVKPSTAGSKANL